MTVIELFQQVHVPRGTLPAITAATVLIVSACSTTPLSPYTEDSPPLILVPASHAGVEDQRGRFREIFCAVLEAHGQTLPDYQHCDDALTRVGDEPEGTGKSVALGSSERGLVAMEIPGIGWTSGCTGGGAPPGWTCFANWLDTEGSVRDHIRQFGYDLIIQNVDALSSSTTNARQIRDAIMNMEMKDDEPRLVLIGYSKGVPDILEAVVSYPEIRERITAVVSASGALARR